MIIEILKFGVFSFVGLWILFANLVVIRNNHIKKMPKPIQVLFDMFVAAPFIILDVLFNIVYGTLLFLRLPRTTKLKGWTFTERCSKILREEWDSPDKSWRFKLAKFICHYMLEPWDYNHCGLARLNNLK